MNVPTPPRVPVGIALLTVSDSRTTFAEDASGTLLAQRIEDAGHTLVARRIIRDEMAAIRHSLEAWIDTPEVDVVLTTGGTGVTGRDVTVDVVERLATKKIPGFGELFRMLSYEEIGTSTIQSRATGVLAATTLIFALPGSPGACRMGWDRILHQQLNIDHRPCNLVQLMPRFDET